MKLFSIYHLPLSVSWLKLEMELEMEISRTPTGSRQEIREGTRIRYLGGHPGQGRVADKERTAVTCVRVFVWLLSLCLPTASNFTQRAGPAVVPVVRESLCLP